MICQGVLNRQLSTHFITYFVFEAQVPRQSATYCVHNMKLSLQHAQPAQASNLRRPARRMHACVPRATAQTENKATLRQPRKENTAGDFYVDHTCIGMRPLQLYVTLLTYPHKALAHTVHYVLPAQLALSILSICWNLEVLNTAAISFRGVSSAMC